MKCCESDSHVQKQSNNAPAGTGGKIFSGRVGKTVLSLVLIFGAIYLLF